MNDELKTLKSLADPVRLRIIMLLRSGEMCVCDLTRVLELPQSTISRHMARLKSDGLVASRRQARWIHYRLPDAGDTHLATLEPFLANIATKQPYATDHNRLRSGSDNSCRPASQE
ncbi:MAG: metalloregulator ArsR/SmtB family transcription factor [bacterium]